MSRGIKIAILSEFAKFLMESDSDSSDEEIESVMLVVKMQERNVISHMRCQNYLENVVPLYTDEYFKMHFRMKRNTFQVLLDLLGPDLCKQSDRFGRNPISPEKQLLIAIWVLATPNSYRCVSDRFDVGKSTAWRSVHRVINALYKKVATFIKWSNQEEAKHSMESIEHLYSFPGVIGAIDGTHIKITAPHEHSDSYVNRKGFHSIQLQVVCNPQLQFIHCYTGQVGSVHDMRIYRLSKFENMCTAANFPNDSHILGDAAYRLTKYVMVPFKDNGHLSDSQKKYNYYQSSTRMIVERSLGLLKGRFRSLLDTLPMRRTDLIPKYIIACCILHNICLLHNDLIDIPLIINEPNEQGERISEDNAHEKGINKRNAIMYSLQNIL